MSTLINDTYVKIQAFFWKAHKQCVEVVSCFIAQGCSLKTQRAQPALDTKNLVIS